MPEAISVALEWTSTDATTWWFAPVGAFSAALAMYLVGIPMTFSKWLPENAIVRGGFEVLVCIILAYSSVFVFWLIWYTLVVMMRFNPFVVVAIFGATILAVGCGGYFWDRSRGPIIWNWDGNWIGYAYNPPLFIGFQIPGRNRGDDPITVTEAYVRSDITGERVEVLPAIEVKGPIPHFTDPIRVIPAERSFLMQGQFQSAAPGAQRRTSDEFQRQFGRLTFVLNGKVVRRFYERDIEAYISRVEDAQRRSAYH